MTIDIKNLPPPYPNKNITYSKREWFVLKGMSDRVEIDGEYYSNNMAPHKELSDQQIADVLTYVRKSWTNKATAVTPAEVKAVRAKIK